MRQYGLIGHPLGHSFSAAFFAQKFACENIDAQYDNFDLVEVGNLRNWVGEHPLLAGFNVTIPHKQAVVSQLDALSPEATEVGAVNVVRVVRESGGTLRLTATIRIYSASRAASLPSSAPLTARH